MRYLLQTTDRLDRTPIRNFEGSAAQFACRKFKKTKMDQFALGFASSTYTGNIVPKEDSLNIYMY